MYVASSGRVRVQERLSPPSNAACGVGGSHETETRTESSIGRADVYRGESITAEPDEERNFGLPIRSDSPRAVEKLFGGERRDSSTSRRVSPQLFRSCEKL